LTGKEQLHILSLVSTEAAIVNNNQQDLYPEETYKDLVDAGVFYGRSKSNTNPKMKPAVLTNRGGIEIINLAKTLEGLDRALGFLKEKVRNGGLVLCLGTQPAAQDLVRRLAEKYKMPYVTTRWPGGTITNFKVISKRVEDFKKMKSGLASGAYQKYTKKEQLDIERITHNLEELMGGLVEMNKLPDLFLIVDPVVHSIAVHEAHLAGIPVVAYGDVDANPDLVEYLVPGNTKSRKSIEWFLAKAEAAIGEGKLMQKEPKAGEAISGTGAPHEKLGK